MKDARLKESYNLVLWFQRDTEASPCVHGQNSSGSLESLMHEAVKVKTELQYTRILEMTKSVEKKLTH